MPHFIIVFSSTNVAVFLIRAYVALPNCEDRLLLCFPLLIASKVVTKLIPSIWHHFWLISLHLILLLAELQVFQLNEPPSTPLHPKYFSLLPSFTGRVFATNQLLFFPAAYDPVLKHSTIWPYLCCGF